MPRRPVLAAAGGMLALLLAACGGAPPGTGVTTSGGAPTAETNVGGDIPDNTTYVPFRDPNGKWEVSVPQGWSRTDAAGVVTFTDKLNSVLVRSASASVAPTEASATANDIPGIRSAGPNFSLDGLSTVHRKAGDAVLINYSVDGPQDPVTGKSVRDAVERYEFFHNGTELLVVLSSPTGADNVDPWRAVTDSVRWL
jgi:hypothetical protein